MRTRVKKLVSEFSRIFTWSIQWEISAIREYMRSDRKVLIAQYLQKYLYDNPKYADPKKLNKYEYQVFSQNGEDGIIAEIFKRIGTSNKFFFEFGVESGMECNTLLLLMQGWRGCWIEGNPAYARAARKKFAQFTEHGKLEIKESFVTSENIEQLLSDTKAPKDLDLLSIDIDGNDYWVWKAISKWSPRVVVIEYNAMYQPPIEFCVTYEPYRPYVGNSYFGASLKTFELLAEKKGYRLVGCNFHGANAFFVREDLVKNHFAAPYTAEHHHEPPRYHLAVTFGHKGDFGPFETPR
jgi:hypothetical protein